MSGPLRETEVMKHTIRSDTSLTELLATGRLRAKKFGKLVLIEGDSLQEFIESLPDATFGDNPPVRRPKDNTPRLEDDTPGASQRKARSAPSNAQPQIAALNRSTTARNDPDGGAIISVGEAGLSRHTGGCHSRGGGGAPSHARRFTRFNPASTRLPFGPVATDGDAIEPYRLGCGQFPGWLARRFNRSVPRQRRRLVGRSAVYPALGSIRRTAARPERQEVLPAHHSV